MADGAFSRKWAAKGGHRVLAAVPDQVFGQLALLLRDGGIAHHGLGVDDGHVQPGLHAVVQEHRVEHFAPRRREAEGDVGDAEDGLGPGQRLFDEADALDRLRAGADVVDVARAHRKHQRVEDEVFLGYAVVLGQELGRAQGHLQLSFAGDGLGLLLVVVDAADHQRGPVAAGQGTHRLEAGLAVFQVHRVDDGLALQPLQRQLDNCGVGRVDHYGRLDLLGHQVQEHLHVGGFVPVRVLQANVQYVRAVAGLTPPDFGRFLECALVDQATEAAAAQHVGALADNGRAHLVVDQKSVDAGDPRFGRIHRRPGWLALSHPGQQLDVAVHRAAAAADDVHPSGVYKPAQRFGHGLRRLVVPAVLVGHPGVGHRGDREPGDGGQRAHVVGHKLGASGAVDPDPQQVPVGQRDVQRLHVLPGQQRPHGFHGALHRNRDFEPQFGKGAVDAFKAGFDVERVLPGFQQQDVHAAFHESGGLDVVAVSQFFEGDSPGDRDGLGGRPHRTGDEPGLLRCRGSFSRLPGQ